MKRSANAGFTLFELLAILAIMAIIAGITVPRVMQTIKTARTVAVEGEMNLVARAVQLYVFEEELFSCIGGMFVINPTNEQVQHAVAAGDIIDLDDLTHLPAASDDPKVGFATVETADGFACDGINATNLLNYVEGGIPNYLTIQVWNNGIDGEIIVSYGVADTDWNHDNTTVIHQYYNITAGELSPDHIVLTFKLAIGEEPKHETNWNGYVPTP